MSVGVETVAERLHVGDAPRRIAWLGPAARISLVVLPVLAALVVWRLSLQGVRLGGVNDYGLLPVLPPAWHAALGVCVIGAVASLCVPRPNGWVIALCVVAVILVLFGTVPVLSSTPHYSWTYKHFGVTRFLELHGQASPRVDIYNRWPGFFALSAIFSVLSAHPDPASYAPWFEPLFVAFDALLLFVALGALVPEMRVRGAAALFFVLGNWVGQDYYSPQAFGYLLSLVLIAVVLLQLGTKRVSRLGEFVVRWVARLSRHAQAAAPPRRGSWRYAFAVAVVIGIDAVIVASHQLTPYVLLLDMVGLTLLGLVRPRWLVLAMAAITFTYLAINFGYVQRNFGIVTSIDPFNNAHHSTLYDLTPQSGKRFNARAGQGLTYLVWGIAAAGALVLARKGLARRALPLFVLAAAPFVVIFGQNYGGEASLRVILFSLPWCGAIAAWAWSSLKRASMRVVLATVVALGMAALFLPAFYGAEELNLIPAGEVRASDYFYAHARGQSVLMLSGPDFPIRYGPRYNLFDGPQSDDDPNLLRTKRFRHRPLGPADLVDVASVIRQYARHGYLVFSTTQNIYASVFRLTPPGALTRLEAAVARSRLFRLWHADRDARIYELVGARR